MNERTNEQSMSTDVFNNNIVNNEIDNTAQKKDKAE